MIELMVSILILSVGLLGLFQMVNATIVYNLQNQLRAEAVTYGDEVMARDIGKPFLAISTSTSGTPWIRQANQQRPVNSGYWNFSSVSTHVIVSTGSTNVQQAISWKYKGKRYTHNLSTLISN